MPFCITGTKKMNLATIFNQRKHYAIKEKYQEILYLIPESALLKNPTGRKHRLVNQITY